jgi:hypothetical protein
MTASSSPATEGDSAAPRPWLSLCVPAYGRAALLPPLLASIAKQWEPGVEVLVAEDASPERTAIRTAVQAATAAGLPVRYVENESNLGYDGNIRQLVALARGRHCFFLGNDDLLSPGALATTRRHLEAHPGIGMLLRGYTVFLGDPGNVQDTVRYVTEPTRVAAGADAITWCFRRSGVISGYVIDRDAAHAAATPRHDGTLFYQMHLTASVLATRDALVVPDVLVLCRDGTPPEFGAAAAERGHFVPGRYTPQARVRMVQGALEILEAHFPAALRQRDAAARDTWQRVVRDYARHFYPFVMDQLALPPREYLALCRAYAKLPVGRHAAFYVNCVLPYLLGRRRSDALIAALRRRLGRTPRL